MKHCPALSYSVIKSTGSYSYVCIILVNIYDFLNYMIYMKGFSLRKVSF